MYYTFSIYDTLSRTKKKFRPISGEKIRIFVCGPTVYDYSHIGHARTYVVFDAFAKYLWLKGFEVQYIQNITNIDDKIIDRAQKLNQDFFQLAKTFETEYRNDMENLGIDSVDKYAPATNYMAQIIDQIERLIEKQYAYETTDGIYYDISKFPQYGKLSGRTSEEAEDGVSRIDESVNKRNKGDFALWKFRKPEEPYWPSPWGNGRPGWHIEDTAITETEFGPQYDIHGSARDLIFPHHESEIAQMEAVSGKTPLVNYWMHTGFLTVNGERMSKSLGNFIAIREFLKKHSKYALRLLILSSHYRSPIDYKESAIVQAESNISTVEQFYFAICKIKEGASYYDMHSKFAEKYRERFYSELDDDFNTPKALAVIFELIRDVNSLISDKKMGRGEAYSVSSFLNDANLILGIFDPKKRADIPAEIISLTNKREQLRKSRNWKDADKIRSEVEKMGYTIEDAESGPKVKPARKNRTPEN